jgi:hypothetical protein
METEEKASGVSATLVIQNPINNVRDEAIAQDEKSNESDASHGVIGSNAFRKMIVKEYVRPNILDDIRDSFKWRNKWGKISSYTFAFAELLVIASTILSFLAGNYELKEISMAAGIVGIVIISLNRFGAFATTQSTKKTQQVNEILLSLGMKDVIPDLLDDIIPTTAKKLNVDNTAIAPKITDISTERQLDNSV